MDQPERADVNSIPPVSSDTFNRYMLALLQKEFPALSEDKIRADMDKLMLQLEARDKAAKPNTVETTAESIPDKLEDVFRGVNSGSTELTRMTSDDDQRHNIIRLLRYYLERAEKGEFNSVCVMSILADGINMECLFTHPVNLYSYLGILQHVLGNYTDTRLGIKDDIGEEEE